MRKPVFLRIKLLVICIILPIFPMGFSMQNAVGSDIGGILAANTNLTMAGSPYRLSSTIQVPTGITLQVETGVVIDAGNVSDIFLVAGTLKIIGSKENPVRIQNNTSTNTFRSIGNGASISVQFAIISDSGNLWKNDGAQNSATFEISNSEIISVRYPIYVSYPKKFSATGNYFFDTGGMSIGFNKCGGGASAVLDDIQISENTFDGKAGYTYNGEGWIVGWVTYCNGSINVRGNYFKNLTGIAVGIAKNYNYPISLVANENYWGSTNVNEIGKFVLDSNDSLEYFHSISVLAPLGQVPTGAPSVSTVLNERLAAAAAKAAAELKAKQEADAKAAAELKAKQEADAKAAAELKAKQEAEAKAAAELKAKQEAEAKAAAELKAKQEADAKAAAELKAKQEADAKAAADKTALTKAQSELMAANFSLADAQKVNREQAARISSFEAQYKVLIESVSTLQSQVSQLNSKLLAAIAGQNVANAKLKKICSLKPKPKGC
jgi:flagellar biosynthesis GTPase FlhF